MAGLGDTFFLAQVSLNSHLFIIISDPQRPPGLVVLANLTSWKEYKDQSCVVEAGEHPIATKKSCVFYDNRIFSAKDYDALLRAGLLVPNVPVSKSLLDRILQGAAITDDLPGRNRGILVLQGLI